MCRPTVSPVTGTCKVSHHLPVNSDSPSLLTLESLCSTPKPQLALCWRSFTSDCYGKAQKCCVYCRLLQVAASELRGALPGWPLSHGTLPQTQRKVECRTFLHCLTETAWGLKKLFENQNSHFFFLFLIWILEHKSINFINVHVMPWIAHFICKRGFGVA